MKRGKEENSSSYRGCKLLLSEDWFEVVRVDCGIASIPPFRIDVLLSSKSIVQSISFHDELSIGNSMSKNRSRGECILEGVESIMTE